MRRKFWIKQISHGVLAQNRHFYCVDKEGMDYIFYQGEEKYPIQAVEIQPDECVVKRELVERVIQQLQNSYALSEVEMDREIELIHELQSALEKEKGDES